jgi:Zn ribbon nucleic-acid-binding protein
MSLINKQNNNHTATTNTNNDDNNLSLLNDQTNNDSILIRECVICKLNIQQENLSAHYSAHFYESPKCKFCDKMQNNPSSYVTHMSCHTGKLFFVYFSFIFNNL